MKSKIIAIVLGVLLIVSLSYIARQEYNYKKREELLSTLIDNSGGNVVEKHYQRDSIIHTVYRDKIIGNTTTEKELAVGKSYVDSLQTALKISIEKMEQVSKINAELTAKLQLKEAITDTGEKMLSHTDKFLEMRYYPHTDSVDFRYNLKLNEVRYKDRKWLLGKTQHYVDVFSDDPRIKINGLNSYRIRGQPQSRWGLGVHTGYGFQFGGNQIRASPIVGIGLNYNLINF